MANILFSTNRNSPPNCQRLTFCTQDAAQLLVKQYKGKNGSLPGLDTLSRRIRGADKNYLKWIAEEMSKGTAPHDSIFASLLSSEDPKQAAEYSITHHQEQVL